MSNVKEVHPTMRMSDLSTQSGVPVATLKYYLREGLLHPGEALNRTQARYDDTHLARVRLVRALTDAGGLSVAAARDVVRALQDPPASHHDLLGVAQHALTGHDAEHSDAESIARARAWVDARGWRIEANDPLLDRLARTLHAAQAAGIDIPDERLHAYAAAMEDIATVDVDAVPAEINQALHYVVVGTVMVDPVLATLRRLAQQDRSARLFADRPAPTHG